MEHKIVINRTLRETGWVSNLQVGLSGDARYLLRTILRVDPERDDVSAQALAIALEKGGIVEFDDSLRDSLRELIDKRCIRIARSVQRRKASRTKPAL